MRLRARKLSWTVMTLALIGCTAAPGLFTLPEALSPVLGGPSNVQPYLGRLKANDASGAEIGDFLLASCGCGDWRAVMNYDDGTLRHQFKVQFYCEGEYTTDKPITVFTQEELVGLLGTVDQPGGAAAGEIVFGRTRLGFDASRGTNHDATAEACEYCHVGNDPIFPLPESHPKRYLEERNICLECHSANGQ